MRGSADGSIEIVSMARSRGVSCAADATQRRTAIPVPLSIAAICCNLRALETQVQQKSESEEKPNEFPNY